MQVLHFAVTTERITLRVFCSKLPRLCYYVLEFAAKCTSAADESRVEAFLYHLLYNRYLCVQIYGQRSQAHKPDSLL
jgi:hypothetical protein